MTIMQRIDPLKVPKLCTREWKADKSGSVEEDAGWGFIREFALNMCVLVLILGLLLLLLRVLSSPVPETIL